MRTTTHILIQVIVLFVIMLMGTANAQQTSSEQSETWAGTAVSLILGSKAFGIIVVFTFIA